MFDLNQVIEGFLDQAVWQCRNESGKEDEAVIGVLSDRNQSLAARRNEVLKRLRYTVSFKG
jgi:hypothetical protein